MIKKTTKIAKININDKDNDNLKEIIIEKAIRIHNNKYYFINKIKQE